MRHAQGRSRHDEQRHGAVRRHSRVAPKAKRAADTLARRRDGERRRADARRIGARGAGGRSDQGRHSVVAVGQFCRERPADVDRPEDLFRQGGQHGRRPSAPVGRRGHPEQARHRRDQGPQAGAERRCRRANRRRQLRRGARRQRLFARQQDAAGAVRRCRRRRADHAGPAAKSVHGAHHAERPLGRVRGGRVGLQEGLAQGRDDRLGLCRRHRYQFLLRASVTASSAAK